MILKKLIQKMKTNTSDTVKLNERKRIEEMADINYDRNTQLYWVGGTAFETHREALIYLQKIENDYLNGCCAPYDEKQIDTDRNNRQEELTKDEQVFKEITELMLQTYIKKNRDYGGAFERGMERDGIISALTRMYDKLDRLHSLKDKDPEVVEETVEDTLMDLANYAIMTRICLLKSGEKKWDSGLCRQSANYGDSEKGDF